MGLRTIGAAALTLALAAAAVAASASLAGGDETAAAPGAAGLQPGPAAPGVARPGVAASGVTSDYTWPLRPEPEVVRRFEPPTDPWGPGHRGVDLAAPRGAPVHAAGAGTVAFAGQVVDRAVVSIDHVDGIRTTYEPLNPVVRAGDRVQTGEVIGHLDRGEAGAHCAADCLHWGARITAGTYLDPLLLLGLEPPAIRLYPIDPG